MSGELRADAEHCAARSKYATEFEFASHVIDARDRRLTTEAVRKPQRSICA